MVRRRPAAPGPVKLRAIQVEGFTLTEGVHPAGSSLPWHSHDGATLCYVLAGSFTEYSAGSAVRCTPTTLKVMPAGERHWNRFERTDTRGLLIEADPARAAAIRPYSAVLEERAAFHGGTLAVLAKRIHQEFRHTDTAAPLAVEGLLLELLAEAARQPERRRTGGRPAWLTDARDLLHEDPAQRGSLAQLAALVGVHPVTLARAFRRAYGSSVGDYVRRLRIEQAARALGDSDRPLAEIALAAGFADQSHFSNVFRRQTGMSPSAFRRWVQRT